MERTIKPWHIKNGGSVKGVQPQEGRETRPHNMEKSNLHDTFLQSLEIPVRKRNPQRDAIQPPPSRRSTSTDNNKSIQPERPVSASPSSKRPRLVHHPRPTSTASTASISALPGPSLSAPSSSEQCIHSDSDSLAPHFDTSIGILCDEPPPAYEETEWTAFLDRIRRDASEVTYEDLLLLEEVNGSASTSTAARTGTQDRPLNASVGLIELLHRRTTKEGKAKLKLVLAGVRVDNCGICLAQFRERESGALTDCRHIFHESCLKRWAIRSPSCPVCRVVLIPD